MSTLPTIALLDLDAAPQGQGGDAQCGRTARDTIAPPGALARWRAARAARPPDPARTLRRLSLAGWLGRWMLVLAIGVAVVVVAQVVPARTWVIDVVTWIRGAGAGGAGVFFVIFVAGVLTMMPTSVMSMAAGFAYGAVLGGFITLAAALTGGLIAFGLGRTVVRGWLERRLDGDERAARMIRAASARGFRTVLLLRLSPVMPFSLTSYGLGLTTVSKRDYLRGSLLGILPTTVLYAYLGSLVPNASHLASGTLPVGGSSQQLIYGVGLAAALLVAAVVTIGARRALNADLEGAATPGQSADTGTKNGSGAVRSPVHIAPPPAALACSQRAV